MWYHFLAKVIRWIYTPFSEDGFFTDRLHRTIKKANIDHGLLQIYL